MSDAQAEAERIVDAYSRARADLDHAVWDHEVDKAEGVFTETQNLLTAALAAAIEVAEDGAPVVNDYTDEAVVQCNHQVWLRLEVALSALRQTDREDT